MAAVLGSPLDQVRVAFEWLVVGPRPLSVDGRQLRGLPGRMVRVDEVRDLLRNRQLRRGARDVVWAYLVRRSRAEAGAWTVACVGCALPDLVRISDRLIRPLLPHSPTRPAGAVVSGVGGDVQSAVLSGFLAELAAVDLSRSDVVQGLLSAAHEAGAAAVREIRRAPIPRAKLFGSAPPPPVAQHPDLVLARAVAAGALTRYEASLIGSTRLEPIRLAEVAAARGQRVRDVRAARIRAERKLSAYLRDHDPSTLPTSTASSDRSIARRPAGSPPSRPPRSRPSAPPSPSVAADVTAGTSRTRRPRRRRRLRRAAIQPAPVSAAQPDAGAQR